MYPFINNRVNSCMAIGLGEGNIYIYIFNGPYKKDQILQSLSTVDATCVLKKKCTFCFFQSRKNY